MNSSRTHVKVDMTQGTGKIGLKSDELDRERERERPLTQHVYTSKTTAQQRLVAV